MKRTLACAFLGGAVLMAVGCGDDVTDEIDNRLDCAEICDKRDDCVTETDESECIDYCEEKADADDATA
ncbi:MAG TPA: hypothetical protein VK524_29685, partial [Polyangiaceae bacterium]|nr:hypothetical protein [Polyangiaceae bacterium]